MPANPLGPLTLTEQERLNLKNITRFGFDRTGTHPDNHIITEQHILKQPNGTVRKAIYLKEGLFFTESVIIRDLTDPANPVDMVKAERDPGTMELITNTNPDYFCSEPSMVVGGITGKEACLIIIFICDEAPDIVEVDYQCVGGQFSRPSSMMQRMTDNIACSDVCYDDLFNVPELFKPEHHGHSMHDTTDWEFMIDAIDRVTRSIELSYIPAFVTLTNRVCEMIREGLKPKPALARVRDESYDLLPNADDSTPWTGARPSLFLDPWPSDEHPSKSDVLMMMEEYLANGYENLANRSIRWENLSASGGNNLDFDFFFLHPDSWSNEEGFSIEVIFSQPDGSNPYAKSIGYNKMAGVQPGFTVTIDATPEPDPITGDTPPLGSVQEVSVFNISETELLINKRMDFTNS